MLSRPARLYKYRPIDPSGFTGRIFTHRELFFSPASSFNDPFESRFVLSMEATLEERIGKFRSILPTQRPDLEGAARESMAQDLANSFLLDSTTTARGLTEMLLAKSGVLCLSERNDDILMWSHYADHHRGLCLEFSTSGSEAFLAERLLPVSYSDKVPVWRYFIDDTHQMVTKVVLTKASHWRYEAEWRIIDPFNKPGPQSFPPLLLTGVILGARVSDPGRAQVFAWLDAFPTPVTVYQSSLRDDSYSLTIARQ
jgi:hypothetical protein